MMFMQMKTELTFSIYISKESIDYNDVIYNEATNMTLKESFRLVFPIFTI